MTLQASRDVMHLERGFHRDTKLISHIQIARVNSSLHELAGHPSNMKEQKLQTKGICYPEPALFFSSCFMQEQQDKNSFYHQNTCN